MTTSRRSGLARLFDPQSIAVIGASIQPGKVGYQLVDALREFPGDVFPINPKAAGRRAYSRLSDAPRIPDLVLLGLPAAACPAALAEAAQLGVGGALIVSGGFGESDDIGGRLQAEIEQICRTSGLRLLGPNTSGYTRPGTGCRR